jgi:hypothetical protein
MTTRRLNIVLGVWLGLSAFLWPHSNAQFWNAAIAGALVTLFAMLANDVLPLARYGNTAAGSWLLLSSFGLPTADPDTAWTHLIVGATVVLVSLRPGPPWTAWVRGGRPSHWASTRRSFFSRT